MNRHSDRLLDEVLEEAVPAAFRQSVLSKTLCQVRRQRQWRRLARGGSIACTIGLALILGRALLPGPPAFEPTHLEPAGFQVVRTQPLEPSLMVSTEPGSVQMVSSSPLTVATVESRQTADSCREVTDEELLLLCAGHPVALVRHHPHQADLVFLNPEHRHGFPVQ